MNKAILVVDMPDKCSMCMFHYPARDMHTGEYMGGCRIISTMAIRNPKTKPDWCPLNPMPEKEAPVFNMDEYEDGWIDGWNACYDRIIKE